MELLLIAVSAVFFAGILLSPVAIRTGAPLLLLFLGIGMLLGLLVTPRDLPADVPRALAIAAVLMFVARPLAAIICLAPLRFPLREQLFIGWVGLRGAVPIFLAIIPVISPGPITIQLFNEVFIVVIASLVLQGWTISAAARVLGVEKSAAELIGRDGSNSG